MSSYDDVTVISRQQLLDDLVLLHHARDMLRRARCFESNKVIAVAIVTLEYRLAAHLNSLGGLASAW